MTVTKRLGLLALLVTSLVACGSGIGPAGTYTPRPTPSIVAGAEIGATTGLPDASQPGDQPGDYNARGNRTPGLNNFVEWRSPNAIPLKIAVAKIDARKTCQFGQRKYYLTSEVILETFDDPDGALPLFSLYGNWEAVAPDGRSLPAEVTYCGGDSSDWLRTPAPNRKYDHKVNLGFLEQPPAGSVLVFTPVGDDHGVEWPIA